MKALYLTVALTLAASAAGAQSLTSETDNTSVSGSSVLIEGANNTPGIAGSAGSSTAPCVITNFVGFGQPGLGLGISVPTRDHNCLIMRESEFLSKLVRLRQADQVAYRATLIHSCRNSKRMRETLVQLGLCVVAPKS